MGKNILKMHYKCKYILKLNLRVLLKKKLFKYVQSLLYLNKEICYTFYFGYTTWNFWSLQFYFIFLKMV